jgi:predicted GNAT superfamily acetyltransferase
LGWEGGVHFHSHQVGVQAGIRGGGVGYALKLAQRALCLRHGVTEMRWTYDPMLFSNARFNLVRLGARVVDVLPHCYGDRRDAFNTGERTDRLEVSWRLDAPIGAGWVEPEHRDVVAVPADYATWRLIDPAAAAADRARVTDHLVSAMAADRGVVGLCTEGYVLGEAGSLGEVGS